MAYSNISISQLAIFEAMLQIIVKHELGGFGFFLEANWCVAEPNSSPGVSQEEFCLKQH